jgi:GTP diphosphokinase / guanosine-3',5'-bis(diphosphate) 3'-diphosphatase
MQWSTFQKRISHLSPSEQECVHKAFDLGKKAHEGQKRCSGEPYFIHPSAVAAMLADMGADEDTIIAALLHDTLEDTSITLDQIAEECDGSSPALIDGVTKLRSEDFQEHPTLDDQIETLRKIFTFMKEDVRIMIIKLADRLHNMQTVEFLSKAKQKALAIETKEVYVRIADQLSMASIRDELERLCLQVLEPDLSDAIASLRDNNKKQGEQTITKLTRAFRASHPQLSKRTSIHYEPKKLKVLEKQLEASSVATGLSDITAAFVCKDIPTCYSVLGGLHDRWKRELLSFEDFINSPMINGYRALHTTIILGDGMRVRCKIRTEEMQEYARNGIVTKCFDSEAMGIFDYLPWTERIATLSADTTDRSEQFWESLKSDILGESILIHGPNDRTVMLPTGSTALDGAFYLFGDKALSLKTIKVNGQDVPFSFHLENAASLDLEIGSRRTVDRTWLQWINTGIATAHVRRGLSGKSPAKKQELGKAVFQEVLDEKHKGFIEEFDQESLILSAEKLGYKTLEKAYEAVADGRLEPETLFGALFKEKKVSRISRVKRKSCTVYFSLNINDLVSIEAITNVCKKYCITLENIRFRSLPDFWGKVHLSSKLTSEEQQSLVTDLQSAGAEDVLLYKKKEKRMLLTIFLVMITIWGLDPIFAQQLLLTDVSPIDLTSIRFIVFFVGASCLYIIHQLTSAQKHKPLSPSEPSLVFAGLMLFTTAICTYFALQSISPTQYILFILAGTTIPSLISSAFRRKGRTYSVIALVIIISTLAVLMSVQGASFIGSIYAACAAGGFALYSLFSRQYQLQKALVQARYAAFLLWLSIIILPFALLLLPFTNILNLSLPALALAVGFVLIFAALPYGLYYFLLLRKDVTRFGEALLFTAIPTIIAEILLTQSLIPLIATPILIGLIWQKWKDPN